MPFDLSYILFFVSLGVSAVAVVVFLWLMRQGSAPHPDHKASPLHPEGGEGEGEGGERP